SVGEGLASPVLVGDKVFTFTRQGGDEVITCLDAGSGKELWKDKYAAADVSGAAAGFNKQSKGTRNAPAVADGKVCTVGVTGTVSCLEASSGKVLWRKETKSYPKFVDSSSPLVADGVCVTYLGSGLTAFDLGTGETKWKWSGGE